SRVPRMAATARSAGDGGTALLHRDRAGRRSRRRGARAGRLRRLPGVTHPGVRQPAPPAHGRQLHHADAQHGARHPRGRRARHGRLAPGAHGPRARRYGDPGGAEQLPGGHRVRRRPCRGLHHHHRRGPEPRTARGAGLRRRPDGVHRPPGSGGRCRRRPAAAPGGGGPVTDTTATAAATTTIGTTATAPATAAAPVPAELLADADELTRSLIPDVDRFRRRQTDDGTVPGATAEDDALLGRIRDEACAWYTRHGRDGQATALAADVDDWLTAGLATRPHFARSRDALPVPEDGSAVFFLAPLQSTNSAPPVGKRLDCFFALRKEPAALPELAQAYPHPRNNCQSLLLITGSAGFRQGNCLVFFPENVAAHDKITEQPYA